MQTLQGTSILVHAGSFVNVTHGHFPSLALTHPSDHDLSMLFSDRGLFTVVTGIFRKVSSPTVGKKKGTTNLVKQIENARCSWRLRYGDG